MELGTADALFHEFLGAVQQQAKDYDSPSVLYHVLLTELLGIEPPDTPACSTQCPQQGSTRLPPATDTEALMDGGIGTAAALQEPALSALRARCLLHVLQQLLSDHWSAGGFGAPTSRHVWEAAELCGSPRAVAAAAQLQRPPARAMQRLLDCVIRSLYAVDQRCPAQEGTLEFREDGVVFVNHPQPRAQLGPQVQGQAALELPVVRHNTPPYFLLSKYLRQELAVVTRTSEVRPTRSPAPL